MDDQVNVEGADVPSELELKVLTAALGLWQWAQEMGLNVEITRRSLEPLAMGNCAPVVTVWPKRGKNHE